MAKKTKKLLKKHQDVGGVASYRGDSTNVRTSPNGLYNVQGNVAWMKGMEDPRPPAGWSPNSNKTKVGNVIQKIGQGVKSIFNGKAKKGGSISTKMKSKSKKK